MQRRKRVLTTGEVASICKVAPRTVSKWFDTGQLRGYRVPGSRDRRIPVDELVRFMRAHDMPLDVLETGQTRVLIVDGDGQRSQAIEEALNRQPAYQARSAASAFSAGFTVAALKPHVVIIDPTLPDVRPAELLASASGHEELGRMRFIAIASKADTRDQLRRQGFDGCLVAPFDMKQVVAAIDAALA